LAQGIVLKDPLGLFVDNNNGMYTRTEADAGNRAVVEGLEKDAQTWERLLWLSGGKLELSKCLYYIMSWHYSEDGSATLKSCSDIPFDITLTCGQETKRTKIKHLDCRAAARTLGVWKAPAGNQERQFQVLKDKSDGIAENARNHSLTTYVSSIGYWMLWLPAVGYALPTTFFAEKKRKGTKAGLHEIQSKALNIWLPKMGICAKTSRDVVFGPKRLGGFGLRHLYTVQGVGQVTQFTFCAAVMRSI
jgi:hypothetical protein